MTMTKIQPITTASAHYPFVEALLHSAFPPKERRDADRQRANTDAGGRFRCNLLTDDEGGEARPVGLLTCWHFDTFVYIEHFAIDPNLRGGGYGSRALETLKALLPSTPILLEVEEPTDETACRRIAFYRRQGFTLHEVDYLQPPYREGDGWLPLKLMSAGGLDVEGCFDDIRRRLYTHVYGVRS